MASLKQEVNLINLNLDKKVNRDQYDYESAELKSEIESIKSSIIDF